MNATATFATPVSLEKLPRHAHATVAQIDWTRLSVPEARRLRELGFDEGVDIEMLHRSPFGKGPIACRIGRMTVALRRAVAASVRVLPA
ncbi:FeoA family protein [Sphingomonas hylomeconis]|uniref:Ferrous iron transport protein A n=1 Tax=Sphingomonas hylomeconis TaxID=1395958 RepID=A0ABV7SNR6_9SPHN|nr:FeoA family protein [Sphingomonas hylomeconis]